MSNPLTSARTPEPVQPGHGIQGMRERAVLLGGRLEIRDDGGQFYVYARLPYTIEQSGS